MLSGEKPIAGGLNGSPAQKPSLLSIVWWRFVRHWPRPMRTSISRCLMRLMMRLSDWAIKFAPWVFGKNDE